MALEEIRTFLDIQDAVIDRAKLEDTSEVRRQLREKINTVYTEVVYEEFYSWSGETRPLLLPERYATGTITVTADSDEITGASTVWSENDHLYLKMFISGSTIPYKIVRVGSSTTITLEQAWRGATASGASYYIYQDEFGLFPDCQAVRRISVPGVTSNRQPLPCGPTEIDALRSRRPFQGGTPVRYSVWGNSHYRSKTWATFNIDQDFWEDAFTTSPRNKNLIVWPGVRTSDVYATVRYTKVAYPMNEDSEEPIIPFENRAVLVYGTLLEHFLQNRDSQIKREWESKYRLYKQRMAGDVETYGDELILSVDNRPNRWSPNMAFLHDENNTDFDQ